MGKSSWYVACCVLKSKWGFQLEKEIEAVSQTNSVWVRAWILPSGVLNVISKRLFALMERSTREG